MKQNLKDSLMFLSEGVDELAARVELTRDKLRFASRDRGDRLRLAEAEAARLKSKNERASSEIHDLSVMLKNGEL